MTHDAAPKRVLVIDDEPLIALGIASECEAAGFAIAGTVGSVESALRIITDRDGGCDVAIVDFNLRGSSALPVIEALRARVVPFIVLSGYTGRQLPPACAGAPFLSKPYSNKELISRLRALTS